MKTGFDFGATRKRPKIGDVYYLPVHEKDAKKFQGVADLVWDDMLCEQIWLKLGHIFLSEPDCQSFCDYLNGQNS